MLYVEKVNMHGMSLVFSMLITAVNEQVLAKKKKKAEELEKTVQDLKAELGTYSLAQCS